LTDFLQIGQRSLTMRLGGIQVETESVCIRKFATKFLPPNRNRALR
jgi:hypothetical protein